MRNEAAALCGRVQEFCAVLGACAQVAWGFASCWPAARWEPHVHRGAGQGTWPVSSRAWGMAAERLGVPSPVCCSGSAELSPEGELFLNNFSWPQTPPGIKPSSLKLLREDLFFFFKIGASCCVVSTNCAPPISRQPCGARGIHVQVLPCLFRAGSKRKL